MRTYFLIFFCVFFAATVHAQQTCRMSAILASTPSRQLVDNGDGTITDSKTGLMWKKCLEGVTGDNCEKNSPSTFTHQKALEYPETINNGDSFAGHTDWRLPSISELCSIIEQQCYRPAINTVRFPNTPSSLVWTKTLFAGHSMLGWCVNFGDGTSKVDALNVNSAVRLVRGGQ